MEELVLVLGSVAGACTVIAMNKIPKRSKLLTGINPSIKNQLQSLKIEKEIITKTISRLYQQESELSKIQQDKLLLRYQHQLGLVIAKIEKLEDAGKHPDFGPLGDGLMVLMDQKLSQLDQRLHEISSKITVTTISVPQNKHQAEPVKEIIVEKTQIKSTDINAEIQKAKNEYSPKPPVEISLPQNHKSVELTTLTEIPDKIPEFPVELIKPVIATPDKQIFKEELANSSIESEKPKQVEITSVMEAPSSESLQTTIEKKIHIPTPIKILDDEKMEEDDKDIDKIKSEIMKALSKLEQVEVE